MIEFEAWCSRCKKETGFETVDGAPRCSVCGNQVVGAEPEPPSTFVKSCLTVLLIMGAIGLVLLAFLFAMCSQGFPH